MIEPYEFPPWILNPVTAFWHSFWLTFILSRVKPCEPWTEERQARYMSENNRLNRTHVVTVRHTDGKFYLILSDGSRMTWEAWVASGGQLD